MKHIFLICLLIIVSMTIKAQEPNSSTLRGLSIVSLDKVDRVPVYKGCDSTQSNKKLKKCLNRSLTNFIEKKFRTSVVSKLKLHSGDKNISVIFKIDTLGNIVEANARSSQNTLRDEALRVLSLVPKFDSPGLLHGEAVVVPYFLPVMVKVENLKRTKRARR